MTGPWRSSLLSLLAVEVAAFLAASLTHLGVFATGLEHPKAGTAEAILGGVLLAGFLGSWAFPALAPVLSFAVQVAALLGTLVGLAMSAVGIGPRSAPDLVFQALLVALLVTGIVRTSGTGRQTPAPTG